MEKFTFVDYTIFVCYFLIILGVGFWASRGKTNASDYFLASKSLPWWAIGASLIAANISAEQFIGMSGSGFAIGLAIASYEWMAAITLLIVGKYFLPIFIEKNLFTIPQFVEKRFSKNLKTILAIFWISLFIFVNLTSVMYLGAKAVDTIVGVGDGSLLNITIICLATFAGAYSLWGGLSAVAWTDVIQVVVLLFGGIFTTYIALAHVSPDGSIINGLQYVYDKVPEKFSMILEKGEIVDPSGKDAWWDLPGISVLLGGMWVANLYYWGFNQYIIQRTLAAKSLKESQKGIVFAAFLKMITPLIVVVPGIVAYTLNIDDAGVLSDSSLDPAFLKLDGSIDNDSAAPWLINEFIPSGLKGLVVSGLIAAIVSSLASMLNSTATIFTMDIYIPYFNEKASGKQTVKVGRISALIALVISVSLAPQLASLSQAFQFIQEYTGVISPGILAVFIMGLFWKKATNNAAIWGALSSIPIALFFKAGQKEWFDSGLFPILPFLDQMMITCLATMAVIVAVSYYENQGKDDEKGITLKGSMFQTPAVFNLSATTILLLATFLYVFFW